MITAAGSGPTPSALSWSSAWPTLNRNTYKINVLGPEATTRGLPAAWSVPRRRGTNDLNCGLIYDTTVTVDGVSSSLFTTAFATRVTTLPSITDTGFSIFWSGGVLDQVRIDSYIDGSFAKGDAHGMEMAWPITWASAPPAWSMWDPIDTVFSVISDGGVSFIGTGLGCSAPTLANLNAASTLHSGHVLARQLRTMSAPKLNRNAGPIGGRITPVSGTTAYQDIFYRQADATWWTPGLGAGGMPSCLWAGYAPTHYKQTFRCIWHGNSASPAVAPVGQYTITYRSLDGCNATMTVNQTAVIDLTKYGTTLCHFDGVIDPAAYIPSGTVFVAIILTGVSGGTSTDAAIMSAIEPGFTMGLTRDEHAGAVVMPGRMLQVSA